MPWSVGALWFGQMLSFGLEAQGLKLQEVSARSEKFQTEAVDEKKLVASYKARCLVVSI